MAVSPKHAVNGNTIKEPFPEGMEMAMFGKYSKVHVLQTM